MTEEHVCKDFEQRSLDTTSSSISITIERCMECDKVNCIWVDGIDITTDLVINGDEVKHS